MGRAVHANLQTPLHQGAMAGNSGHPASEPQHLPRHGAPKQAQNLPCAGCCLSRNSGGLEPGTVGCSQAFPPRLWANLRLLRASLPSTPPGSTSCLPTGSQVQEGGCVVQDEVDRNGAAVHLGPLPPAGIATNALPPRPHPGPGRAPGGDWGSPGVHLCRGDGVLPHHTLQPPHQVGAGQLPKGSSRSLPSCQRPGPEDPDALPSAGTGQCWTQHCGQQLWTGACTCACSSAAGSTRTPACSPTCGPCRPSATLQPTSQWMW